MSALARVMDNVVAYRLWQAPFAERKLAPVLRENDLRRVRRVLDVGCGPGTNTHHFLHTGYLGLDCNESYVAWARERFGKPFVATDVRVHTTPDDARYDFVLVNSFLHHVDLESTRAILGRLARLLTDDGHVHILELTRPPHPGVARLLARLDRGHFARPTAEWRALFEEHFLPVHFEQYAIGWLGIPFWEMVYFKGRRR